MASLNSGFKFSFKYRPLIFIFLASLVVTIGVTAIQLQTQKTLKKAPEIYQQAPSNLISNGDFETPGSEMAVNGGFENGTTGYWSYPLGFGSGKNEVVSDVKHGGDKSMRTISGSTEWGIYGDVVQNVTTGFTPGQKLTFSAYYHSSDNITSIRLQMGYTTSDGVRHSWGQAVDVAPATGANEWKQASLTFIVPGDTTALELHVMGFSADRPGGYNWVDDFSLVKAIPAGWEDPPWADTYVTYLKTGGNSGNYLKLSTKLSDGTTVKDYVRKSQWINIAANTTYTLSACGKRDGNAHSFVIAEDYTANNTNLAGHSLDFTTNTWECKSTTFATSIGTTKLAVSMFVGDDNVPGTTDPNPEPATDFYVDSISVVPGAASTSPSPGASPSNAGEAVCTPTIATISVTSTGANTTRIAATAPEPYANVELRVKVNNVITPYQGPTIEGEWSWIWIINSPIAQIQQAKFYVDVTGLGQGGSVCGTWTPSASASPSPSASASPASGTTVNIEAKFDSVPANNNSINLPSSNRQKPIKIIFIKKDTNQSFYNQTADFNYSEDDKFWHKSLSFNLSDLPAGTYIIKLKGPSHRQIKFDNINIQTNAANNIDLTNRELDFGDVDGVDGVTVNDDSALKVCKALNAQIGGDVYDNQGCKYADGNFDGVVDSTDMQMLRQTLSANPDDE